ncbi:mCG145827, partial [Mus musculus]
AEQQYSGKKWTDGRSSDHHHLCGSINLPMHFYTTSHQSACLLFSLSNEVNIEEPGTSMVLAASRRRGHNPSTKHQLPHPNHIPVLYFFPTM